MVAKPPHLSDQSPISYKSAKLQKASEGSYREAAPAYNMTTKTREAKPKWCSPCKKTRRGITTDEGFRCNQCAEEMGFTIKKRKGQGGAGRFASPMENLFGIGRSAADSRAAQIATADGTMRRRAAAKKAAATRRRKAAVAARKALLDGMVKVSSLPAFFVARMNGVCKGCKGRLPVPSAQWIEPRPGRVPSVVCSECAEKVNA